MKVLANDGISASGIAAIEASGHELITTKVAQEQLEVQWVSQQSLEPVSEFVQEQLLFLEQTQAMRHVKHRPKFLLLQFRQPDF